MLVAISFVTVAIYHPQFSRSLQGTPGTMTHQVQTRPFRKPEFSNKKVIINKSSELEQSEANLDKKLNVE